MHIVPVCVQGKNAGKFEQYQLAEIKHSRLAMLAFSGSVASSTPSASLRYKRAACASAGSGEGVQNQRS